jgi:hypothetical protein
VEFARIANILKDLVVHGAMPEEDRDQEAKGRSD